MVQKNGEFLSKLTVLSYGSKMLIHKILSRLQTADFLLFFAELCKKSNASKHNIGIGGKKL